jgi:hypothetical protein
MSEVSNSKDNEPSKDLDDKTENGAGNQLGKEAEEKIKEKPTGLFPTLLVGSIVVSPADRLLRCASPRKCQTTTSDRQLDAGAEQMDETAWRDGYQPAQGRLRSDEISSGRSLTFGSPASATVLSVREEAKTQFFRNILIGIQ